MDQSVNQLFLRWLIVLFVGLAGVAQAQVSGNVFRDFNGNGTKDPNEPLVAGVTVNAYSTAGTLCGTTMTTGTGAPNYSLAGCGTGAVRIEFIVPATGECVNSGIDFSALGGAAYGSSVQFVNGNSTNVNFAINNPADYNQGVASASILVPCYVNGDPTKAGTASSSDWFVSFPYSNTGVAATTAPTRKLDGATIGAVWGVSYSKQARKTFTSAFLKRHVGFGTLGSGGIYLLTPTASSFTAVPFFDMDNNSFNTAANPVTRTRADATAPAYGNGTSFTINSNDDQATYLGAIDPITNEPSGLGVVGTNVERQLVTDPTLVSFDPAAFDQVGKVGLGSIEISDDGKFLFVVNLYSRKLFRLELDNVYNPTSVIAVTSYTIPDPGCNNGKLRPWATKYYRGKLYVGAVCSGENGGQNIVGGTTDLYAYVYELTNPIGSASFTTTPVLSYPLNYHKGPVRDNQMGAEVGDFWYPWNSQAGDAAIGNTRLAPILSDIDFTENGDMIMDFTDRAGHQWGDENYKFLANKPYLIAYIIGGDMLMAGKNCANNGFTLENNGSFTSGNGQVYTASTINGEGPGTGEFFTGDAFLHVHHEASMGSVALLQGVNQAYITTMDPINFDTGGTKILSTANGTEVINSGYELYQKRPGYGKANGLGDVEIPGILSPIEIGNRVWDDNDNDGIQDAGETGISGVSVSLVTGAGALIATAVTDANGNYYFSSGNGTATSNAIYNLTALTANTTYQLKFPTTTSGKSLVAANASADNIDSDAPASGIVSFSTAGFGANDHTFDVGYSAVTCALTTTATPTACNSATNQYDVTGTISLTSNTVGGTATMTDGAVSTTVSVAVSATSVAYSLTGLVSDGASHTVTVSLAGCGSATATYTAPSSCSVAPVCSLSVTVSVGTCATATNTYSATVTVTALNPPAGASLSVVTAGRTLVFSTTAISQNTFVATFNGLTSDGVNHPVVVSLPGCGTTSASFTAPVSCSVMPVCSLSAVVSTGQCSTATNTFSNTVTVTMINPSAGMLTVSDGVRSVTVIVPATIGTVTTPAVFNGLVSDGSLHTVTVSLPGCSSLATSFSAPLSCSVVSAGLGDYVFLDANKDGVQNAGDIPISGVTVILYTNGVASATTVTNASGFYSFTGLTPGTSQSYVVGFTPPAGYTTTTPLSGTDKANDSDADLITGKTQSVTLGAGEFNPTLDAGFYLAAPTLSLDKFVDKSKAKIGDVLTYTLVLTNSGIGSATNVVVRDSSSTGLSYVANSATAPAGTTFTAGVPASTWRIATISGGQSLSLTFQTRVDSSGILYNKAIIPGDTAMVCTSIPVVMCAGDVYTFRLTAAPGRSSYKWYKDNVEISGQTTNVLDVSAPGTYSLAVDNVSGKCPDFGCCPFIIEEDMLPTFRAVAVPVTCIGNVVQANAKIVLSGFNMAYTYQYSLGTSFNSAASLSGAKQVIPTGGTIVSNLANPVAAQSYTIRVYNASGCYTDVTVQLLPTVCGCPAEVCVPLLIRQTKRAVRLGALR